MHEANYYLEFYKYYYGSLLPQDGLCNCFPYDPALTLFYPAEADGTISATTRTTNWDSGLEVNVSESDKMYAFTPLRQTIVLFMAQLKEKELYEER